MTGMVAQDTTTQSTTEIGTSNALIKRAYFRVPALTTPARTLKMDGSAFAQSFTTQKLAQMTSNHTNKPIKDTTSIFTSFAAMAVTARGTDRSNATGKI